MASTTPTLPRHLPPLVPCDLPYGATLIGRSSFNPHGVLITRIGVLKGAECHSNLVMSLVVPGEADCLLHQAQPGKAQGGDRVKRWGQKEGYDYEGCGCDIAGEGTVYMEGWGSMGVHMSACCGPCPCLCSCPCPSSPPPLIYPKP